jgi:hypothetical protein
VPSGLEPVCAQSPARSRQSVRQLILFIFQRHASRHAPFRPR